MKSKLNSDVKTEAVSFPAAVLLKSKALSEYQRDFAKVILGEGTYTVEEAKAILDKTLKKGE